MRFPWCIVDRFGKVFFDISQELFGCEVFPGDEAPQRSLVQSMERGNACNLTNLSLCAHNGTHVDAPFHFYRNGKTIDRVALTSFVGLCYVGFAEGMVTAETAEALLEKAGRASTEAAKRILIGGKACVTAEAARVFAGAEVLLLGNESQTVGPPEAPAEVHLILLGAGTVLLEGIRLSHVKEGVYFLNAAPINLGGADGAPCRAILTEAFTGKSGDIFPYL